MIRGKIGPVFLAALAGISGRPASAQQGILVGGVVVSSATGQSLPYSAVSVSNGIQRFTGADGSFSLALTPGTYSIRIRQLGYAPLDTAIAVNRTADFHALNFALKPVAFRLAAVQTFANSCAAGQNSGDLGVLLDELIKNAEREKLLRTAYPFMYDIERRSGYQSYAGTGPPKIDTVRYLSTVSEAYVSRALVEPDSTSPHGPFEMRIPALIDLADAAFMGSHCFRFRGVEHLSDAYAGVYRVDFDPSRDLKGTDVEGSVYVDSANYLIRKAVFRLTKPEKLKPPVLGFEVTTTYRQIFNGLTLFEEISSVQNLSRNNHFWRSQLETQKLIAVKFYGQTPEDVVLTEAPAVARSDSAIARTESSVARTMPVAPKPVVDSTATLAGTVVDSGGRPLRGADVRTADGALRTVSGDSGQFVLHGFKPGKRDMIVRVLGYGPATFTTDFRPGRTRRVRIVLTAATVQLSTIVVLDSISDPLLAETGFFQRKRTGWGTFITPAEIQRRNPGRASDMLRMVSGMEIRSAGRFGTLPISRRAMSFSGLCLMNVYVDGNKVAVNSSMPLEDAVSGSEIGAMEVYPSASETPPEFSGLGASAPCGAVVIWTKGYVSQENASDSTKHW